MNNGRFFSNSWHFIFLLVGSVTIISSNSHNVTTAALVDKQRIPRRKTVAIVTGGTRGIGHGISQVLAKSGDYQGLLLTYNRNHEAAEKVVEELRNEYPNLEKIVVVGGDLAVPETRQAIFEKLDQELGSGDDAFDLALMVHNAGQYVGITSDNDFGLKSTAASIGAKKFGDGSLLKEVDQTTDFSFLDYYHKLYGEAYVDLCEQSLIRMKQAYERCQAQGLEFCGSLIGISAPGVSASFYAQRGYDMPGSGKCLLEYATRQYAMNVANPWGITANVIAPGVTISDAWERIAHGMGMTQEQLHDKYKGRVPLGKVCKGTDIGDVIAFLCKPNSGGRFITGMTLRVDGGLHLGP